MLTYQDYMAAGDKPGFIKEAIEEYKGSDSYRRAAEAQKYYKRKNTAILERLTYLQRQGVAGTKVKFHKLCNGYFPKFIKQQSQYLLANGVTIDKEVRERLGSGFDITLQEMGMQCLVDGVNWGFWDNDHLEAFRATEFLPLPDERTAELRAGIRFWQIASDRPLQVELYEEDGITEYSELGEDGDLVVSREKRGYLQKIRRDALGETVEEERNYNAIPIIPLYANELKESEFTDGIKSMIDAYDFISSDLVDGITQVEGIYWVIKNYGGNDVNELLAEIQDLKATYTDDDTGADNHVIEVPFQAKQAALDILRTQLYADYMAFDIKAMTGGSLTNVAINTAKTDFDLKADIFEWQCINFVASLMKLLGMGYHEVKFKRRSITNDTETIANIYTFRSDIDHKTALEMNPLIADSQVDEIIKRFDAEGFEKTPGDDDE